MAEEPTVVQIQRWYSLVLSDVGIRQLGNSARNIIETLLTNLATSVPADRTGMKENARVALLAETEATLTDRRGAPGWRSLTANEAQTAVDSCERYAATA